jgi:hypothetical protein
MTSEFKAIVDWRLAAAGFDFGQKKQPPPWITFLAVRAIVRGQSAQ